MVDKVKTWCEHEMRSVLHCGGDAQAAITRCYGIVMFVTNSLLEYDSPEAKELGEWWDNEMAPWFRAAISYQHEINHAPNYINTDGVGAT